MDNQIDPQIKNLVSAIGRAETGAPSDQAYNKRGKSGEFGRYQFMPDTYRSWAKKYIGDENAPPTVENQNKIAYSRVKEWKDKGYNPAQIASMWNAGEGRPNAYREGFKGVNSQGVAYDVPAYALKVSRYYNQLKGGQPDSSTQQITDSSGYVTSLGEGSTLEKPQQGETGLKGTSVGVAKSLLGTVREAGQFGTGVARGVVGLAVGKEKAKQLLPDKYGESKFLSKENLKGKSKAEKLGKTVTDIGSVAVPIGAAAKSTGVLSKGYKLARGTEESVLKHPEITKILKNAVQTRRGAINRLTAYLNNMPLSKAGGETEQLILKAIKELNPTSKESRSLVAKLVKGGWDAAKVYALTKILGDTVGGFVNRTVK